MRRRLHAAGLRYRLHSKELPGKPDLVFAAAKTAVFGAHGVLLASARWLDSPQSRARMQSSGSESLPETFRAMSASRATSWSEVGMSRCYGNAKAWKRSTSLQISYARHRVAAKRCAAPEIDDLSLLLEPRWLDLCDQEAGWVAMQDEYVPGGCRNCT